jgi:hypothetical protein
MSKGKQRPPQYIRQSKGYQQNMYKNQLKEKNVQMPKTMDMDKILKYNRILAVVLLILSMVLLFTAGWKWALLVIGLGLVYAGGFFWYMNNYMKKVIKAYKLMGVPKDLYVKQLRKSGTDVKNVERMSRIWDKVKVD